MKIVFGGAFNPVTHAHIEVYKYVMSRMDANEFIFLPVSNAYTKSELESNFNRKNMLELAIKDYKDTSISDLELEDSDYLGTYQSLIRLSDKYNTEIAFVVGADNLFQMHKWINIHGILSEFKIVVLGRNDININKFIKEDVVLNKHLNSFIIYEDFEMNISSTKFRETFDKDLIDNEVYKYIIKNELYRGE
jgi:nicotinate-nucleotide adenylyltransferase